MAGKGAESKQYDDYPVEIGLPAPPGADGRVPRDKDGHPAVDTWVRIASSTGFGISRLLAYTLAQRGVPTAFPKPENLQDVPNRDGWFTVSVRTARTLSESRAVAILAEAAADRAILAGRESRERARLGNMVGELRGIAESAANPKFRHLVNRAMMYLSAALETQIMPDDPAQYGYTWERGYVEKLRTAQDAWQEAMRDEEPDPDEERLVLEGWSPASPLEAMLVTHDPKTPQA